MKLYKITPLILQATLWPFTRVILKLFVNFKVEGIHNIEEVRGAIIFASNHVSELDPVLVRAALPCFSRFAPLFYVSRENYLDSIEGIRKHLYGGVFFKAWGAYPVEAGKKDYAKSLKNHVNLLKDGCSVCIFPEGRMSEDGNLGEVQVEVYSEKTFGSNMDFAMQYIPGKKGTIIINIDTISVITKTTIEIDNKKLDIYKLEMMSGNDHFVAFED